MVKPEGRTNPHIRWMIHRDLPSFLSIERHSFEDPWSEDDAIRCLRQRNCMGMVAEIDECVAGFFVYELHRLHIHLLNMAVHCCFRDRGIGTALVEFLKSKLSHRRNRVLCEIRETNVAAQLFFRNRGFRAIAVVKDFYRTTTEDAYMFQLRYGQDNSSVQKLSGIQDCGVNP